MRHAEFRSCPRCGDTWATLDHERAGDVCPSCRAHAKLSRYRDGRLPGEPEGARAAPPPSREEGA